MSKQNKFLIFRTDRIGDFLTTAILIKSIKRNNPNSHITVIASQNNFTYIDSFHTVDEVILLKSSIFNRLKLLLKLRKFIFDHVIVHDNKNRSILISFFLKKHNKILLGNHSQKNHIDIIKFILSSLNYNFNDTDLNILDNRKNFFSNLKFHRYLVLHFDEKWIKNSYIKSYKSIEPTEYQLITFLNKLHDLIKLPIVVTTGIKTPKLMDEVIKTINNNNISFLENLNFFEIETIISKSAFLISCHGFVSHVAAANNIKQVDIIDRSYNYERWNKHFRNYFPIYREPFDQLIEKIFNKV